jgi:hypothetical protein
MLAGPCRVQAQFSQAARSGTNEVCARLKHKLVPTLGSERRQ